MRFLSCGSVTLAKKRSLSQTVNITDAPKNLLPFSVFFQKSLIYNTLAVVCLPCRRILTSSDGIEMKWHIALRRRWTLFSQFLHSLNRTASCSSRIGLLVIEHPRSFCSKFFQFTVPSCEKPARHQEILLKVLYFAKMISVDTARFAEWNYDLIERSLATVRTTSRAYSIT